MKYVYMKLSQMKKHIFLFCALLISMLCLRAQSSDSWLKNIRQQYYSIQEKLHTYDTTMLPLWGESTEGGQAIAYYDDSDLKLIQIVWLGETGKNMMDYYFDKGQLIFAFEQYIQYNRPIFWNEEVARENGDNEVFDPEKSTVEENRYYFHNQKLFLWLDPGKDEVDLTQGTNTLVGKGLIAHAFKMKGEIEQ